MKAKILFTIGPATSSPGVFQRLAQAANGVRINTAHGSTEDHEKLINFIRKNSGLPIVLDVKGPELRVFLEAPMEVCAGEDFELGFSGANAFSYDFSTEAKKGDKVFFDDGKLEAEIISLSPKKAVLRAADSHVLKSGKNAHIPKRRFAIPALSKKDSDEIRTANRYKVEYVALSFTRSAKDVKNLRKMLDPEIAIIAKIESQEGLGNIDGIISEADGVMVARGDLALDIGQEKVPLAQKMLIRKSNEAGKLAITATQVLETMISNPYPTRAEVSDIANAVLDGSDAVMLSGETAIGKYPAKAVETIRSVAKEVENSVKSNVGSEPHANISEVISRSIYTISHSMHLGAIVSITRSGYTAKAISRFRLKNRIIAVTPNEIVKKQLMLYFGVEPVLVPEIPESGRVPAVGKFLHSKGLLKKEETALFTAGVRTREKHASNLIEIQKISDLL